MMDKFNQQLVMEKWDDVYNVYERLRYTLERRELVGTIWDNETKKETLKKIETFINDKFNEYEKKEELTALVLCANHKIRFRYNKGTKWSDNLARIYDKMWKKIHWRIEKKLKWNDLSRYYRAVD